MAEEFKEQLDQELVKEAREWAGKVIKEINAALSDPSLGMGDSATRLYKELNSWGYIENGKVFEDLALPYISMARYKDLKSEKDNPKKSKWEVVMGRSGGKLRGGPSNRHRYS